MDEHREMKVTPDRYLTYRYAGASGDFNPIHLDDDFARSVGLPGRILHGLWTMAQVARAQTEAGGGVGGFLSLRSLEVQFRGVGLPEHELTISSTTREQRDGGELVIRCDAEQGGKRIIRNGEAVVRPTAS
jgi:acyl dehydratase